MKNNRDINITFYLPTRALAIMMFVICLALGSCIKDFNISTKANKPQLVVEAYINNLMREYNYVVLSRSLNYFDTSFQSVPVTKANVYITEGEFKNNQYNWDPSTKIQLFESDMPSIPANFKNGVYFDPRLVSNPQNALLGSPGKMYLLEINEDGNQYSAIASLLQPVPIDSVTLGFRYIDEEDGNTSKVRITNHYKDPDTLNNTQFYYYRFFENRFNYGWGGLSKSRSSGSDDLTNGQYINLTHPRGFVAPDTVTYYMASVTRDVYNFWDSYNKARDNNGPFSTPVLLKTNMSGENVTGCFSGLSLSTKTILIK